MSDNHERLDIVLYVRNGESKASCNHVGKLLKCDHLSRWVCALFRTPASIIKSSPAASRSTFSIQWILFNNSSIPNPSSICPRILLRNVLAQAKPGQARSPVTKNMRYQGRCIIQILGQAFYFPWPGFRFPFFCCSLNHLCLGFGRSVFAARFGVNYFGAYPCLVS